MSTDGAAAAAAAAATAGGGGCCLCSLLPARNIFEILLLKEIVHLDALDVRQCPVINQGCGGREFAVPRPIYAHVDGTANHNIAWIGAIHLRAAAN